MWVRPVIGELLVVDWDSHDPTDWDTIADWSGHDVRTLLAYYVVPFEEATKRDRGRLDQL